MDVEAQDDGVMAKIMAPDGTKGVKVGTRIAVIADQDDDLSSLEIPDETSAQPASRQEESKSGVNPAKSSESQSETPLSSKGGDTPPFTPSESASGSTPPASKKSVGKAQKQTYPLYPSVAQLLHEKGIPSSEADKIPATGPKGRLLKGDVLAYLGTIKPDYSAQQSARITKLGHLDLSNIKIAPPKEAATTKAAPVEAAPTVEPDTEIAVSISLKAVRQVQKRIHETLGIDVSLHTFIARAIELSNDELPKPKATPTTDELFNSVLGLDNVDSKTSRGSYTPQITALPAVSIPPPRKPVKKPDIIDILTSKSSTTRPMGLGVPHSSVVAASSPGAETTVFSLSVAPGEEQRARVFLERMKTILQVEPGRLVI